MGLCWNIVKKEKDMEYVNAFWIGGLICALIQILLDRTKMMPGRVMVLLVCGGAVLGFLNIYEPFLKFAEAGASVPLLGFGTYFWLPRFAHFRPENEEIVKRMSKKCKILLFSSVDNVMVKIVSLLRGFEGGNL